MPVRLGGRQGEPAARGQLPGADSNVTGDWTEVNPTQGAMSDRHRLVTRSLTILPETS